VFVNGGRLLQPIVLAAGHEDCTRVLAVDFDSYLAEIPQNMSKASVKGDRCLDRAQFSILISVAFSESFSSPVVQR
jgi:hypothetical protein